ncbi:hypothetical protein D3C81_1682030 [compost metagenome]
MGTPWGKSGEVEVAVIAGQQASIAVAHRHRQGNAIDQGAFELQAIVELLFGLAPLKHLDLQPPVPGNDQSHQRQHTHEKVVELRAISHPYVVG